ncbi:head maturation protease, ClpP-related [Salinispora arenicola]|uniref:head maturation protease, ClpP-related n=1 Tax=Salinispora arenicola TaxID=168697 RepID=UPI0027DC3E5F|nr:head maturation protease, ClpP-related [Salinispora arenicola]
MSLSDLAALADRARALAVRNDADTRPGATSSQGWYRVTGQSEDRARVYVYDTIGWDTAASDLVRALDDITAGEIVLRINSPGGLVWDGLDIYSALKGHPARVEAAVTGVAASAASLVAMAADHIAVEQPARMMIHRASGLAIGNARDLRDTADVLESLDASIAQIYQSRAGGPVDAWAQAMDHTTWYTAAEAVAAGLAGRGDRQQDQDRSRPGSAGPQQPTHQGTSPRTPDPKGMIMRTIDDVQQDMTALVDGAEGRAPHQRQGEPVHDPGAGADASAPLRGDSRPQHRLPDARPRGRRRRAGPVAPPPRRHRPRPAFVAYLRTGQPNADLTDLRPTNAQSGGVGSEGGYLVPPGFRQRIIERMAAFGGIANVCDVLETDSGNRLEWPTIDDTANSGEVVAEGAAHSGQSDLVFGKKELSAYTYQTGGDGGVPLRLSRELIQDQAFDLEARLARLMGLRLARAMSSDLAVGSGVDEPPSAWSPGSPVSSRRRHRRPDLRRPAHLRSLGGSGVPGERPMGLQRRLVEDHPADQGLQR